MNTQRRYAPTTVRYEPDRCPDKTGLGVRIDRNTHPKMEESVLSEIQPGKHDHGSLRDSSWVPTFL